MGLGSLALETIVSKKSENCWRRVLKQSVGPIPITTYRLEDLVNAPFTHAGFCAFVDCRSLSCLFLFGLSCPSLASSFLLPSLCVCVCVCESAFSVVMMAMVMMMRKIRQVKNQNRAEA